MDTTKTVIVELLKKTFHTTSRAKNRDRQGPDFFNCPIVTDLRRRFHLTQSAQVLCARDPVGTFPGPAKGWQQEGRQHANDGDDHE